MKAYTTTARHWIELERQRERVYKHRQFQHNERATAVDQIRGLRVEKGARPVHAGMSDVELSLLADARAEAMSERITADRQPRDVDGYVAWVNAQVEALDARPLRLIGKGTDAEQLAGVLQRVQCRLWWRRQLKRQVLRLREARGVLSGEVCATRRQPYVTDDTVRRLVNRDVKTAAMLDATEIESADGTVLKLSTAIAASVSNKPIRRGELMTRITGCEQLADECGDVGLFVNATAPSRFHATLRHGAPNPRARDFGPPPHDLPRRSHQWLGKMWARVRAALSNLGVGVYGFRFAEPHHDGTAHWHMLMWCAPAAVESVKALLHRHWRSEDGREPGAAKHRLVIKTMDRGGAAAYASKYVSKGIDDAGSVGAEGHTDEYGGESVPMPAQQDMFGGGAARISMWVRSWGLRQFQPFGQPPVTVWRELRRVEAGEVLGASHRTCQAWVAAHRTDDVKASWAGYVRAQGGLMNGRLYAVRIAEETKLHHGRYESIEKPRPVGVFDPSEPHNIVRSARREWRPKGAWRQDERRAPKAPTLTRTRFNNCTRGRQMPTRIGGVILPKGAPLVGWRTLIDRQEHGAGVGINHRKTDHERTHHPPQPEDRRC